MAVVQASGDRRWRIILKHLCLLVRSRRKADSIPQLHQHFRCKTNARTKIYPTPPIRPYTQRVASSGEQLDPCSNQFRSDAVERDASPKLFGAKAGGSPSDQKAGSAPGNVGERNVPHAAGAPRQGSERPPRAGPAFIDCNGARAMRGGAEQSAPLLRDHLSALPALRALPFTDGANRRLMRLPRRQEKTAGGEPGGWRYNREETPDRAGAGSRNPATSKKYFALQQFAR